MLETAAAATTNLLAVERRHGLPGSRSGYTHRQKTTLDMIQGVALAALRLTGSRDPSTFPIQNLMVVDHCHGGAQRRPRSVPEHVREPLGLRRTTVSDLNPAIAGPGPVIHRRGTE